MVHTLFFQLPQTQEALTALNKDALIQIREWVAEVHTITSNTRVWGGDIVAKRNDMALLKQTIAGLNALIHNAA